MTNKNMGMTNKNMGMTIATIQAMTNCNLHDYRLSMLLRRLVQGDIDVFCDRRTDTPANSCDESEQGEKKATRAKPAWADPFAAVESFGAGVVNGGFHDFAEG